MYKITITKKEVVTEAGQEWKKISDKTPRNKLPGDCDGEYGYVDYQRLVEKESTIYSQIVDNLNLVRVIEAVNRQEDILESTLKAIYKGE